MAGARPRRYAEALFELAKERGTLDEWRHDLRAAVDQLGNEQTLHQLSNPELQYDQVRAALQATLGARLAPEVLNLLLLLVRRQHLLVLPQVADRFDELVDRERHVEKATVRSAVPLTAPELEALQARLATRRRASKVLLQQEVDPAMVGGVIIRIGDTLMDGSVDARLASLRQALLRKV